MWAFKPRHEFPAGYPGTSALSSQLASPRNLTSIKAWQDTSRRDGHPCRCLAHWWCKQGFQARVGGCISRNEHQYHVDWERIVDSELRAVWKAASHETWPVTTTTEHWAVVRGLTLWVAQWEKRSRQCWVGHCGDNRCGRKSITEYSGNRSHW